jgi:nitrite reductase (NADH) small subunit
MATFLKVAKAADVEPGCGKSFEVNGKRIALFNVEGALYAIDDTCTHRGGPLSEGELNGNEVSCPWHGARFDVTSGAEFRPTCAKRRGPIRCPHRRRGCHSRTVEKCGSGCGR